MRNTQLEEAQAGIKIAGRTIIILRYVDDTTLMAENEEKLKSLFKKIRDTKGTFHAKMGSIKDRNGGI